MKKEKCGSSKEPGVKLEKKRKGRPPLASRNSSKNDDKLGSLQNRKIKTEASDEENCKISEKVNEEEI